MYVGVTIRYMKDKREEIEEELLQDMKYAVEELGSNAVQLFFGKPDDIRRNKLDKGRLHNIKRYIIKKKTKFVIHSSFSINLCLDTGVVRVALNGLITDLRNAAEAGAIGCVLHTGIFTTRRRYTIEYDEAVNMFVENTKKAIKVLKEDNIPTKIIIETPALPNQICTTFELFNDMYKKFSEEEQKYIGICIDTAHIHSAGYDIRTEKSARDTINLFDNIIGLDKVLVIHYNDSKQPIGTGIDQHHAIGYGYIGNKNLGGSIDGLRYIASIANKRNIPLIQETVDNDHELRIKQIRNLFNNYKYPVDKIKNNCSPKK